MTTARTPDRTSASAYPMTVDELTDRVRDTATRDQAWPSLRQIMADHHVGRPKATAALDALRASGFTPTLDGASDTDEAADTATPVAVTALHLVPATAPDDPADEVTAGAADDQPDAVPALVIPATDAAASAPEPITPDVRVAATTAVPDSTATTVPRAASSSRWGAWPLVLIALGAFVSIWGGWVGLGELTGFGPIRLLPGITDQVVVNSAITLPIGVEAYAAFALRAWLAPAAGVSDAARRFARRSTIGALVLGAAGQIAYHLMVAAGVEQAPWLITAFVSCLPVVVLGCGAALTHLLHTTTADTTAHGEAA